MKIFPTDHQKKPRRILPIYLVYLLIVTFLLSGVSFSQYATTTSGEESARVAAFDVSQTGSFSALFQLQVMPGFRETYEIVLTNKSEVTVDYTLSAEQLADNIPLQIRFLDESGLTVSDSFSAGSSESRTYTLEVVWDASKNNAAYSYEVDAIRVVLTATQVG